MPQNNAVNEERIAEMKLLALFNLASMQEGLKVHNNAGAAAVAAAQRLHDKGLATQPDGGYLTDLGVEAAEHLQAALTILES